MAKAFIYFRHTPQGLKFLPSFDLSPMGESKKLITSRDPYSQEVSTILNLIIATIKMGGGFNPRNRPDFAKVVSEIKGKTVGVLCQNIIHLSADKKYGERIYIEF